MGNPGFYTAGGTVQAGRGPYVERRADAELLEACRTGTFAFVLTARQTGKSSLLAHAARRLRAEGTRCAIADLTKLGTLGSAEQWYLGFLTLLEEPLGLKTDAVAWWAARAHLGLRSGRYVAFLGTIEPRKNVPALVTGWHRAVSGMADPPALVVAGGRGWDTGVDEALATVPSGLEVLLPGYLPLELLPGLLGGADVVAYPSSAEGFGLPVLEAMACGAPVLTTTSLALPEVGGDAVEYVDPTPKGIEAALRSLLARPERRSELSAAAVRRAASFTWTASAEQHLRSYARAVTD